MSATLLQPAGRPEPEGRSPSRRRPTPSRLGGLVLVGAVLSVLGGEGGAAGTAGIRGTTAAPAGLPAGPTQPSQPASASSSRELDEARRVLESGAHDEAERLYRQLLIEVPDDPAARSGWAQAVAAQGRVEEAATGLARAAERALRRDRAGAAVDLLEQAVGLAPDRQPLWERFGEALMAEQRHRHAEEALRRAVELDAEAPGARLLLAAALWENGRLEEAESHYLAASRLAPDSAVAWYQLGRFLVWRGDFAGALPPLERAVELGLDALDVRLQHARALDGLRAALPEPRHLQSAVEAWRRVVARAPEEAFARYGLAQALRAAGDVEAARRELEVYERLYRRDQELTRRAGLERAALEAARSDLDAGREEQALARLEELAETVEVLELRARGESRLGRRDRAVALLERALALDPGRGDLRRRLDGLRAGSRP